MQIDIDVLSVHFLQDKDGAKKWTLVGDSLNGGNSQAKILQENVAQNNVRFELCCSFA